MFISYARADLKFALRLADDLRNAGVPVWIDKRDIPRGARWDEEVERALVANDEIVVILSPVSVGSKHVMDEVAYALDEKKRVVPVLYQPCKIPLLIRRVQYVDFTSSYEEGLAILTGGNAQPVKGAEPKPVPAPKPVIVEPIDLETDEPYTEDEPYPEEDDAGYGRVVGALVIGAAGALICAGVMWVVDGRQWALSALWSGIPWAIAGAICGLDRRRLVWTAIPIAVVLPIWLLIWHRTETIFLGIGFIAPLAAMIGGIATHAEISVSPYFQQRRVAFIVAHAIRVLSVVLVFASLLVSAIAESGGVLVFALLFDLAVALPAWRAGSHRLETLRKGNV